MDIKIDAVLRWIGSKKRLIDDIKKHIPKNFNNYYEPFLGSSVVYLNMPFKNKAYINDFNPDLINIYNQIKSNPKKLINLLKKYKKEYSSSSDKKDYYLKKRERFNKIKDKMNVERAALYIYINKCGFNGIMQINKYGNCTTGFGKMNNPKIVDETNVINFNKYINTNTTIKNSDYSEFLINCKKGDFVYMDPPYVPCDKKQYTIKYIKDGWKEKDFEKLVEVFKELDKKECYVMLSNSNCKFIREKFPENKYKIKKLKISRVLCPNAEKRDNENELLIMNY
jgi:DNA adenine methylase